MSFLMVQRNSSIDDGSELLVADVKVLIAPVNSRGDEITIVGPRKKLINAGSGVWKRTCDSRVKGGFNLMHVLLDSVITVMNALVPSSWFTSISCPSQFAAFMTIFDELRRIEEPEDHASRETEAIFPPPFNLTIVLDDQKPMVARVPTIPSRRCQGKSVSQDDECNLLVSEIYESLVRISRTNAWLSGQSLLGIKIRRICRRAENHIFADPKLATRLRPGFPLLFPDLYALPSSRVFGIRSPASSKKASLKWVRDSLTKLCVRLEAESDLHQEHTPVLKTVRSRPNDRCSFPSISWHEYLYLLLFTCIYYYVLVHLRIMTSGDNTPGSDHEMDDGPKSPRRSGRVVQPKKVLDIDYATTPSKRGGKRGAKGKSGNNAKKAKTGAAVPLPAEAAINWVQCGIASCGKWRIVSDKQFKTYSAPRAKVTCTAVGAGSCETEDDEKRFPTLEAQTQHAASLANAAPAAQKKESPKMEPVKAEPKPVSNLQAKSATPTLIPAPAPKPTVPVTLPPAAVAAPKPVSPVMAPKPVSTSPAVVPKPAEHVPVMGQSPMHKPAPGPSPAMVPKPAVPMGGSSPSMAPKPVETHMAPKPAVPMGGSSPSMAPKPVETHMAPKPVVHAGGPSPSMVPKPADHSPVNRPVGGQSPSMAPKPPAPTGGPSPFMMPKPAAPVGGPSPSMVPKPVDASPSMAPKPAVPVGGPSPSMAPKPAVPTGGPSPFMAPKPVVPSMAPKPADMSPLNRPTGGPSPFMAPKPAVPTGGPSPSMAPKPADASPANRPMGAPSPFMAPKPAVPTGGPSPSMAPKPADASPANRPVGGPSPFMAPKPADASPANRPVGGPSPFMAPKPAVPSGASPFIAPKPSAPASVPHFDVSPMNKPAAPPANPFSSGTQPSWMAPRPPGSASPSMHAQNQSAPKPPAPANPFMPRPPQ